MVIEGRCGIAPDETSEAVKEELASWLKDLEYRDEWFKHHPAEIEWFGAQWLPNDLPDEHPLISALESSFEKMKGAKPVREASPWGTDGGLCEHAGQTPVIVFGPGEVKAAHQANEYIEIRALIDAVKIISLLSWNGAGRQMGVTELIKELRAEKGAAEIDADRFNERLRVIRYDGQITALIPAVLAEAKQEGAQR